MRTSMLTTALVACSLANGSALAVDVPTIPRKLIVVDKTAARSKASVSYLAKDKTAGITKGGGTSVQTIEATLSLLADAGSGSAAGTFVVPAGNGWRKNTDTLAKYVNPDAPDGASLTKVALIKPGKLLKLVAKGLGESPFRVGATAPTSVFVSYCIDNAGERTCHCSQLTGCRRKTLAKGSGVKLLCRGGQMDAICRAGTSASSTTSTTITTTTTSTTTTSIQLCAWGLAFNFESGNDFNTVVLSGDVIFAWLNGTPNSVTVTANGTCPGEVCVYRVGDASEGAIAEAEQRAITNDLSGLTPLACGPATGSSTYPTDSSYLFVVTGP